MQGRRNSENALARVLPGVPIVEMAYRRRDRHEKAALRAHFDEEGRGNFLRSLVSTQRDRLLANGLTAANLASLEQGRVPRGYQVHHIRPLDDGGTNDHDNLVLIRAHPEHEAIHRYLDPQIERLAIGESRVVRLPEPSPGLYTAGARPALDRRVILRSGALRER
jgi:hypothetical protein